MWQSFREEASLMGQAAGEPPEEAPDQSRH